MLIEPLQIEGAWLITPQIHGDQRGAFLEWFKAPQFAAAVGHPLDLAQANCSVSSRGVVRGIHYADVPPSQAKYFTCVAGSVLDVIVDIREGSPTFGKWQGVPLDDVKRQAVYLSEGLGHGFAALSERATTIYLCSTGYNPGREHGVHPLDAEIGIDWGVPGEQIELSTKDAAAPTLAAAGQAGALPLYEACRDFRASLS